MRLAPANPITRLLPFAFATVSFALLAGCETPGGEVRANAAPRGDLARSAPEGAEAGTCWDKTAQPAEVETTTTTTRARPSGRAQGDTIFTTVTREEVVITQQETWFQIPCPADLTPEFVSSLQRALSARGKYSGPVTGRFDSATAAALGAYQTERGLSGPTPTTLTVAAARELGLWAARRTP